MTTRIVTIAAGLVFVTAAFVSCNRSSVGPGSTATPQPSPSAADLAVLKALLFADQSLEELLEMVEPTQSPPPDDPLSLFASSVKSSRTEEAKNYLRRVLDIPQVESRIQLLAWKGLRRLGEQPPADIADEVQGVVTEIHNESGIGTLAVYADGRARWLGAARPPIVWEAPGTDAQISAQVTNFLKAAEPFVPGAPLSDTHKTPEPPLDQVRVSVLTFRGIRTVEAHGPSIEEGQPIARLLEASVSLLESFDRKSAEAESKQKPSPR
jgi:hypothetical protein